MQLYFIFAVFCTSVVFGTTDIEGRLNNAESRSYYGRIEGNMKASNRMITTFLANLNFPVKDAQDRVDLVIRNAVNAMIVEFHRLHCKVRAYSASVTRPFCETLGQFPVDLEITRGKTELDVKELETKMEQAINRDIEFDGPHWRISFVIDDVLSTNHFVQIRVFHTVAHWLFDGLSNIVVERKLVEFMNKAIEEPEWTVPAETPLNADPPKFPMDEHQLSGRVIIVGDEEEEEGGPEKEKHNFEIEGADYYEGEDESETAVEIASMDPADHYDLLTPEEARKLEDDGPTRFRIVQLDFETFSSLRKLDHKFGASITSDLLAASYAAYEKLGSVRKCIKSSYILDRRAVYPNHELKDVVAMLSQAFAMEICVEDNESFWDVSKKIKEEIRSDVTANLGSAYKVQHVEEFGDFLPEEVPVHFTKAGDRQKTSISNLGNVQDMSVGNVRVKDFLLTSNAYFLSLDRDYLIVCGTYASVKFQCVISTNRHVVSTDDADLFAQTFKETLVSASLDENYNFKLENKMRSMKI